MESFTPGDILVAVGLETSKRLTLKPLTRRLATLIMMTDSFLEMPTLNNEHF